MSVSNRFRYSFKHVMGSDLSRKVLSLLNEDGLEIAGVELKNRVTPAIEDFERVMAGLSNLNLVIRRRQSKLGEDRETSYYMLAPNGFAIAKILRSIEKSPLPDLPEALREEVQLFMRGYS